jgi:hypothetical protein
MSFWPFVFISNHQRHPELVSGSIGRFAQTPVGLRLLGGSVPDQAQDEAAKWTLKQVQGDDVVRSVQ